MGKIWDMLSDKPWLIAIAGLLGLYLFRGGSGGQQAAGTDYGATLASMDIASRTNVAMAEIAVAGQKVAAENNKTAADMITAISLGAQQYAGVDRQARLLERVSSIEANSGLLERVAANAAGAFQSVLGQSVALKSLENEAFRLSTDRGVAYRALGIQEHLGLTDYANALTLNERTLTSNERINAMEADLARDLRQADNEQRAMELPWEFKTFDRQMANLENLYWRQKQIAKIGANSNLFGSIIGAVGDVASAGLTRI